MIQYTIREEFTLLVILMFKILNELVEIPINDTSKLTPHWDKYFFGIELFWKSDCDVAILDWGELAPLPHIQQHLNNIFEHITGG